MTDQDRSVVLPAAVYEAAAKAIYENVRAKAGNQNWPAWEDRDDHRSGSWLRSAQAALDAAVQALGLTEERQAAIARTVPDYPETERSPAKCRFSTPWLPVESDPEEAR